MVKLVSLVHMCVSSWAPQDTQCNFHVTKKDTTWNTFLIIKEGKKHLKSYFQEGHSSSLPQRGRAVMPLCSTVNPHEAENSCYSLNIALAQDLPSNQLQDTSRLGITDQSLLLLHLIYVSVNEWYM